MLTPDPTPSRPALLVLCRRQAYRNTVPVPRHWSQKRKYLQGKRGLEKPPFQLPDFIEATGIAEMRSAYQVRWQGRGGGRDRSCRRMQKEECGSGIRG